MKINRYVSILALVAALVLWPSTSEAQQLRAPGSVGIGGQVGSPSGVSVHVYNPDISYDFLAAWDLDDFYFFNLHALFNRHLGESEQAHIYFGPGGYVGFRDITDATNETVAGISGTLGVGFLFMPMELFAQVTPRLDLTPATEGEVGGGIGLRFYF